MILKLDVDIKVPKKWIELWKKTRIAILESLGYKVEKIIIHPSSKRGFHGWIYIKEKTTDKETNMLQWLLGDDTTRVFINMLRIKRGFIYWNKLFSRVRWRKPIEEPCKSCKLRKYVIEMNKELD